MTKEPFSVHCFTNSQKSKAHISVVFACYLQHFSTEAVKTGFPVKKTVAKTLLHVAFQVLTSLVIIVQHVVYCSFVSDHNLI